MLMPYLLHALAGCLTTSLVYHAAARGIEVDEVESKLEGNLDLRGFLGMSDEVHNGYERIRVSYRIKGVDEETAEALVRIAQARSPVFDIVTNRVPVQVGAWTLQPGTFTNTGASGSSAKSWRRKRRGSRSSRQPELNARWRGLPVAGWRGSGSYG
jgi:uncharacterized OsmC-like protein